MGLRNLAKRILGVERRPAYYLPWLTRPRLQCALVLSNVESRFKIGYNRGSFPVSAVQYDACGAVAKRYAGTLPDAVEAVELALEPVAGDCGFVTVSGERINSDIYVALSDGEACTATHGRGEFVARYDEGAFPYRPHHYAYVHRKGSATPALYYAVSAALGGVPDRIGDMSWLNNFDTHIFRRDPHAARYSVMLGNLGRFASTEAQVFAYYGAERVERTVALGPRSHAEVALAPEHGGQRLTRVETKSLFHLAGYVVGRPEPSDDLVLLTTSSPSSNDDWDRARAAGRRHSPLLHHADRRGIPPRLRGRPLAAPGQGEHGQALHRLPRRCPLLPGALRGAGGRAAECHVMSTGDTLQLPDVPCPGWKSSDLGVWCAALGR